MLGLYVGRECFCRRWFLVKTRWGLVLRAVGETMMQPDAIPPPGEFYSHDGGSFWWSAAGLGGRISLWHTRRYGLKHDRWERLSSACAQSRIPGGRAEAIFGAHLFWRDNYSPPRSHLCAYSNSAFMVHALHSATIVVLVLISYDVNRFKLSGAGLFKLFHPSQQSILKIGGLINKSSLIVLVSWSLYTVFIIIWAKATRKSKR